MISSIQFAMRGRQLLKLTQAPMSRKMCSDCKAEKSTTEQLKKVSKVIPETGVFKALKKACQKPIDVTITSSFVLDAMNVEPYQNFLCTAIEYGNCQESCNPKERLSDAMDYLFAAVGSEIAKDVPGNVSTEIDLRLSFDTKNTVEKALKLIELFDFFDLDKKRIQIRLPATWEGIQAAKILESKHDVRCNLTMLYSLAQAAACAEAGVTVVTAAVGQMLDWHMANTDKKTFQPLEDPGVIAVTKMYNYFKKFGHKTLVVATAFKNIDQIKALAGCDIIAIRPALFKQLDADKGELRTQLSLCKAKGKKIKKIAVNESNFRWLLNEDRMTADKLSECIRERAVDAKELEAEIRRNS